MKWNHILPQLAIAILAAGCATPKSAGPNQEQQTESAESYYLPDAKASEVVSVTNAGPSMASVIVQTHAVAVKETGPKETLARFGEVYAFSPAFLAVHRDEPTRITFWNLQPDDNHDFLLYDTHQVYLKILLPPLLKTTYIFTFHREGLFNFLCAMHQPSMAGQILVLPPRTP